jgi:hypothetical protein
MMPHGLVPPHLPVEIGRRRPKIGAGRDLGSECNGRYDGEDTQTSEIASIPGRDPAASGSRLSSTPGGRP